MPGLASVAAGVIAGRFIGRLGSRTVLAAGPAVVALSTLPLVFLGPGRGALVILVVSSRLRAYWAARISTDTPAAPTSAPTGCKPRND
ncbi:hypothetical protein [Actinoallomurus iriomotensis]|uniref:Uncharacterized protein n=1 Tax=Actinoallomurus iriomotensis TaxID=478107 RepID=A0A9W6RH91_9ACTN|nr:hypothetical protein [Actinoallomurus iriomotensis]GLY76036.1 hypothetical protein Airi01_043030 [Actinoallomurus iriomotensis]